MLRNLGGAIGIAALQTFLTRREQFHSSVLTQSMSLFQESTRARIDELVRYFLAHGAADPAAAWRQATVAIGRAVRQQAYILAFADTFFLLGAGLIVALVAALLLKKPDRLEPGGGH
jgi:DHA2 family multidrug resistance protein